MKSSPKLRLRPLGRTGFAISPIGFGAFKIGRNQKTKYSAAYDLPSDEQVAELLDGLLALGINYIDTAPAYGTSEERIGRAIAGRRAEFVLATKVGETFEAAQWTQSSEAAESLAQMAARGAKGDPKLAALVRERQDLVAEWQKRDAVRSAVVAQPKANTLAK